MRDMMKMMKQAKDLQKNMENVQKELANTEVTGKGGEIVEVKLTCNYEIRGVKIKPSEEAKDIEILEDFIQIALEDALNQVKHTSETQMAKVTGGLQLPGM